MLFEAIRGRKRPLEVVGESSVPKLVATPVLEPEFLPRMPFEISNAFLAGYASNSVLGYGENIITTYDNERPKRRKGQGPNFEHWSDSDDESVGTKSEGANCKCGWLKKTLEQITMHEKAKNEGSDESMICSKRILEQRVCSCGWVKKVVKELDLLEANRVRAYLDAKANARKHVSVSKEVGCSSQKWKELNLAVERAQKKKQMAAEHAAKKWMDIMISENCEL